MQTYILMTSIGEHHHWQTGEHLSGALRLENTDRASALPGISDSIMCHNKHD